jgi:hypothetical protein
MADHSLSPNERADVGFFGPTVRALDDEVLLQAEKLILDLIEHPGWVLVQDIIAETVDVSTQKLRYDPVKDHATVARDIGFQAGLESQKSITKAILHYAQKRQKRIAESVERRERTAATAEA